MDFFKAFQVFLDPLEQFLAHLKCQCSAFCHDFASPFLIMLLDDHFNKLAHGAFRFPDLLADPVVQVQRDFTGHALGFHVHRSFAWFFPFRATQAYPKSEEKAITKTNNLSAKAGATNVTSNNGYVGDFFGGFYSSSMRVLRKPSISGGMASSGCRTGWEGAA